jgi:hypothetical protein
MTFISITVPYRGLWLLTEKLALFTVVKKETFERGGENYLDTYLPRLQSLFHNAVFAGVFENLPCGYLLTTWGMVPRIQFPTSPYFSGFFDA